MKYSMWDPTGFACLVNGLIDNLYWAGAQMCIPFHVFEEVFSIILLKLFVISTILHNLIVGVLRVCVYSGIFIGSISPRSFLARKWSVIL